MSEDSKTSSLSDHAEPIAWLRPGEYVPVQGCPFGAIWISDQDDPRAFPVFTAPPAYESKVRLENEFLREALEQICDLDMRPYKCAAIAREALDNCRDLTPPKPSSEPTP